MLNRCAYCVINSVAAVPGAYSRPTQSCVLQLHVPNRTCGDAVLDVIAPASLRTLLVLRRRLDR